MNVSGGSIATDGLGCEAQTGYGCGYLDMVVLNKWECGGTGGSYGGQGLYGYSSISENN